MADPSSTLRQMIDGEKPYDDVLVRRARHRLTSRIPDLERAGDLGDELLAAMAELDLARGMDQPDVTVERFRADALKALEACEEAVRR